MRAEGEGRIPCVQGKGGGGGAESFQTPFNSFDIIRLKLSPEGERDRRVHPRAPPPGLRPICRVRGGERPGRRPPVAYHLLKSFLRVSINQSTCPSIFTPRNSPSLMKTSTASWKTVPVEEKSHWRGGGLKSTKMGSG